MPPIPRLILITGILLILLGATLFLVVYIQHQTIQPTALIPTGLGILLVGSALLAKDHLSKHMVHAAMGICVLGILGSATRIPITFAHSKYLALSGQIATTLLCLALLLAGILSFIQARRNPTTSTTPQPTIKPLYRE